MGRGDDHPGAAMAYYASRGETPLAWGGSGADGLGLSGAVTDDDYEAIYGPGGARDPRTDDALVCTRRPGVELVVAAHKSVALLGVLGHAEDMHAILDAESDATLAYLDQWARGAGGRRGMAAVPTATGGLVWSRTRHATSRAGDPAPHDHVLVANLVEMADPRGGHKGLDTGALREVLHAATAVGRHAAAAEAMRRGYGIEADNGPSGRLGHWRIAGVPAEACEVFSKRSAEISAAVAEAGHSSYAARGIAARTTRAHKRHSPPDQLLPSWHAELEAAGYRPADLIAEVEPEGRIYVGMLQGKDLRSLAGTVLSAEGRLAERKVFSRHDAVVAVAPLLFGYRPDQLGPAVDAVVASPEAIPLLGVKGARERVWSPAVVVAREHAVAEVVARMAEGEAAAVRTAAVTQAIEAKEAAAGHALSAGQRAAVEAVCTSGRGIDVVVGVAGAGKTTALDAARAAFEDEGYRVLGTSTSAQAARTLGLEANLESRTLASLRWRLDHGRLALDERTALIIDEAGMTNDADLLAVLSAAEAARSKVIAVGDFRQLGAVGPGGGLEALVARHPDAVHTLADNVRQRDAAERRALEQLRAGEVAKAIRFYRRHARLHATPDRDELLRQLVEAWLADALRGKEVLLLAWRRTNVGELNSLARARWAEEGRLSGPEITLAGRPWRAGDRVVVTAPNREAGIVTSQRGTVAQVHPRLEALSVAWEDGRTTRLAGEAVDRDHLDRAYATTVHRSQGATCDLTHLLADGGGRELAYVAMSRARGESHAWLVADDDAQAVEDLSRSWDAERRQHWAIDLGTPASRVRDTLRDVVGRLTGRTRRPTTHDVVDHTAALRAAEAALAELHKGQGRAGTPLGEAQDALRRAVHQRHLAEQRLEVSRGLGRAAASRAVKRSRAVESRAETEWQRLAKPEIERLEHEIDRLGHESKMVRESVRLERQREQPFKSRVLERTQSLEVSRAIGIEL